MTTTKTPKLPFLARCPEGWYYLCRTEKLAKFYADGVRPEQFNMSEEDLLREERMINRGFVTSFCPKQFHRYGGAKLAKGTYARVAIGLSIFHV